MRNIRKLSPTTLEGEHRVVFDRALHNVLSSEPAKITFAQIVDSLPLQSVVKDSQPWGDWIHRDHPIYYEHDELCPGVMETLEQIMSSQDIDSLQFDSTLIYAFKSAAPGSRAFQTRLIEMITVSVHQIAVRLFQLELSRHHDDDEIATWEPPRDEEDWWDRHKMAPPSLFIHPQYRAYHQYPDGAADGVGYWAENRILGGVVLFDRRDPDSQPNSINPLEIDPNAIYFHSDGEYCTYRIYQLLDSQRQELLRFLLSAESTPPANKPSCCPLPVRGDGKNWKRVDPEEDAEDTGIYRDVWERESLGVDGHDERDRDVWCSEDYPTVEAWAEAWRRKYARQERIHLGLYRGSKSSEKQQHVS
ncbi:hypothetical protein F5Y17DRAFT_446587 [Xylariaceae sp. FL0594]|nr:hypothetical protein F5Y17DRAFT_446587 [Xylariaceae sp. FL0594]